MGYGLYFFIDIQTSSKPQQKTRLVVIEDKDELTSTSSLRVCLFRHPCVL